MLSPTLLLFSSLNTSRQNSTVAVLRESILCRTLLRTKGGGISEYHFEAQIIYGVITFHELKSLRTLLHENLYTHQNF